MKKSKWFFLTLALVASTNCRVKSDGLAWVANPGTGSGGSDAGGGTEDSGSTTIVGTGGLGGPGSGGEVGSGGATGAGGASGPGGGVGSGGTSKAGGTTGTDGATSSGGAISSGGAAGADAPSSTGGGISSGGAVASGGTTGTGGASGAGGSPNPDGANERPGVQISDVPPETWGDAVADAPANDLGIDAPVNPGDAKDAVEAASPDNRPAMTLVWSDEFDSPTKTGVNPAKWSYVTWGPGQVNNEAQAYTNRLENVFQDGTGNLVIRALNTPNAGNTYTSGRIESNGHFSFRYGRVEVRAKLPAGIGSFPGIIAMGNTGTWPQCGELAIMEQYGQNKSWFYVDAIAGGAIGSGDTGNVKYTFPDATTASNDFHVYSLDWYADHLAFQVDGIEITHTTFATSSPFYTIPEYLILDLALGGTMGGTIDTSAFPMEMMVDYVRVYSF